MTKRFIIYMN